MNLPNTSLKKRYFSKLIFRSAGTFFSAIVSLIAPRALGPQTYGSYTFLQSFFENIVNFFEAGTSSALFSRISRRPSDTDIIIFYFYYLVILSLLILLGIGLVYFSNLTDLVWPSQKISWVVVAAITGILLLISQVMSKILDGYALTIVSEKILGLSKCFLAALIIIIYVFFKLNLLMLFTLIGLQLLFVSFFSLKIIKEKVIKGRKLNLAISRKVIVNYSREFFFYSHPLFILLIFSSGAGLFDRWLLQFCSGGVQQGYYGLAFQISQIFFLLASSLSPLLFREFSIQFHENNIEGIRSLFNRYVPILYTLMAFFGCFMCMQSENLIRLFGGKLFEGALWSVAIISFYPLHQLYGQVGSTVLNATDQTKLYRNVGIVNIVFGILTTYFLIAPSNMGGLGLGAVGLSIKMVVSQFFGVTFMMFFVCRYLKISFLNNLAYQFKIALYFFCISASVFYLFFFLFKSAALIFVLSALTYSIIAAVTVIINPTFLGLGTQDIQILFQKMQIFFRGVK